MTLSRPTAWLFAAPGMIGLAGLSVLALFALPARQGYDRQIRSKAVCLAALKYVIQTESGRPSDDLGAFEQDSPAYCRNALIADEDDDGWTGSLVDQVTRGAVYVRIDFGPRWRNATGKPGRVVVVNRTGVVDPT